MQTLNDMDAMPTGCATGVVNEHLSVYLELQGALNAEAESEKLRKKKDELEKLVFFFFSFSISLSVILFIFSRNILKLFEVLK